MLHRSTGTYELSFYESNEVVITQFVDRDDALAKVSAAKTPVVDDSIVQNVVEQHINELPACDEADALAAVNDGKAPDVKHVVEQNSIELPAACDVYAVPMCDWNPADNPYYLDYDDDYSAVESDAVVGASEQGPSEERSCCDVQVNMDVSNAVVGASEHGVQGPSEERNSDAQVNMDVSDAVVMSDAHTVVVGVSEHDSVAADLRSLHSDTDGSSIIGHDSSNKRKVFKVLNASDATKLQSRSNDVVSTTPLSKLPKKVKKVKAVVEEEADGDDDFGIVSPAQHQVIFADLAPEALSELQYDVKQLEEALEAQRSTNLIYCVVIVERKMTKRERMAIGRAMESQLRLKHFTFYDNSEDCQMSVEISSLLRDRLLNEVLIMVRDTIGACEVPVTNIRVGASNCIALARVVCVHAPMARGDWVRIAVSREEVLEFLNTLSLDVESPLSRRCSYPYHQLGVTTYGELRSQLHKLKCVFKAEMFEIVVRHCLGIWHDAVQLDSNTSSVEEQQVVVHTKIGKYTDNTEYCMNCRLIQSVTHIATQDEQYCLSVLRAALPVSPNDVYVVSASESINIERHPNISLYVTANGALLAANILGLDIAMDLAFNPLRLMHLVKTWMIQNMNTVLDLAGHRQNVTLLELFRTENNDQTAECFKKPSKKGRNESSKILQDVFESYYNASMDKLVDPKPARVQYSPLVELHALCCYVSSKVNGFNLTVDLHRSLGAAPTVFGPTTKKEIDKGKEFVLHMYLPETSTDTFIGGPVMRDHDLYRRPSTLKAVTSTQITDSGYITP